MFTVIAPPTISFLSTFVAQPTIVMMAAASFACFLAIMATVTLLTCQLMNDALTNTNTNNTNTTRHYVRHPHDKIDAGSWKLIMAVEDHAMKNLAPSSESSLPSNGSRAVPANNKVRIEETKTKNPSATAATKFVGPAFVEYRDPQPEFDDDDDDDESATASVPPAAPTTDIIYPEGAGPVFDEEEEYRDFVFGGAFHDYREPPKNDFEDDESVASCTDDNIMEGETDDDNMEELWNAFSTLSLGDSTSKTSSDDDGMAELVDSFAKL